MTSNQSLLNHNGKKKIAAATTVTDTIFVTARIPCNKLVCCSIFIVAKLQPLSVDDQTATSKN